MNLIVMTLYLERPALNSISQKRHRAVKSFSQDHSERRTNQFPFFFFTTDVLLAVLNLTAVDVVRMK